MPYIPKFRYTDTMTVNLMRIEGAKVMVENITLPEKALKNLSRNAEIRSTHFSTKIEGNTLGLREVEKVVRSRGNRLGKYEQEVRNYWRSLEFLKKESKTKTKIDRKFVQRLHRIIDIRGAGRRGQFSPYRVEQNVIGNHKGNVVYRPPEPDDVKLLMDELLDWVESKTGKALPVPVWAGIFSYRFLSIHPFMDGNGRAARALATYMLHREGYGLRGIFSVEDYYCRDIAAYYDNLQMGLSENYYLGRNDPDMTRWIEYFIDIVRLAFEEAGFTAGKEADKSGPA